MSTIKAAEAEWVMFIDPKTKRKRYAPLCQKCQEECKQSFRAEVVCCPKYSNKNVQYLERTQVLPDKAV